MQVTVKVFRFNPEKDKKPHYETYKLEAEPTDRVLDMLEYIKGILSMARFPSAVHAPMASVALTRCASTGAITWRVKRC